MITRRHLTTFLVCTGIVVLAVGATFFVQHLTEEPEAQVLTHNAPPTGIHRGKIVLALSSAMVRLAVGPPGAPLRVESSFDPDVYTLEQHYEKGSHSDWTWRLDFHERSVMHISVIGIWLGKRSPEVTVLVPPDLPFNLDAIMKGGYLVMDFANLNLSTADVELDRGVLHVSASEPMEVPMERLNVLGRSGTVFLKRLGNASPERLDVHHHLGAAVVDLHGRWRNDADIHFRVSFGNGELRPPRDVKVEGLGHTFAFASEREIPPPTLRIGTHSRVGDIRVNY